jgi:hypothetical protein
MHTIQRKPDYALEEPDGLTGILKKSIIYIKET